MMTVLLLIATLLAAAPNTAARTVHLTCRDGVVVDLGDCRQGCRPFLCDGDHECNGSCTFVFAETCGAWWCLHGPLVVPIRQQEVIRSRPGRRLILRCGPHPRGMRCPPPTTSTTSTTVVTTTTLPLAAPCRDGLFPTCDGICPAGGVCAAAIIDGLGGCGCFSPSSPCGETSPVCNGACGAGERCVPLGPGVLRGCGCIPEGSTPCGGAAPVCGGACPADEVCRPGFGRPELGSGLGCFCGDPRPCGQGGIECPNGFGCGALPPELAQCFPILCGSYPSCGGGCAPGTTCVALVGDLPSGSSFGVCLCALPGSCDSTCGAYDCPSGRVCRDDVATGICGCGPP